MEYVSAKEAAERWRVGIRVVQGYCKNARVPGARKYGVSWMIPADAEKPVDPRGARKTAGATRASRIFLTCVDLPKNDPEVVLRSMDAALRPLTAADIAFRRGDPEPIKAVWRGMPSDDKMKLSAASLATAAAISSGDYALYDEIQRFLRTEAEGAQSERDKALLSLPGTLAAVSMAVPVMTPDWLKACDFSLFPEELHPFLLYLYALHLRNAGAYAEMLGVVKAVLTLIRKPLTFTWLEVYLSVLCAVAANALGEAEQARRHLDAALMLGLPCAFIAPFADYLGSLGEMLRIAVEERYPGYYKPIVELWTASFKNWMHFHNLFTKERVTTILTAQEYNIAKLLLGGATNAETARRLHLSPGRVKNIVSGIYGKLHIDGRQELNSFIL